MSETAKPVVENSKPVYHSDEKNFKFTSSLIKAIAIAIALMVMAVSTFAFIFFTAAMLPTLFAAFFDKNKHRCLSATICSFNLIGVIPYLVRMWESRSIDYIAKLVLADVSTWITIYGAALVGQILYATLPLLFVKLYSTKIQINIEKLRAKHKILCEEWGIKNN